MRFCFYFLTWFTRVFAVVVLGTRFLILGIVLLGTKFLSCSFCLVLFPVLFPVLGLRLCLPLSLPTRLSPPRISLPPCRPRSLRVVSAPTRFLLGCSRFLFPGVFSGLRACLACSRLLGAIVAMKSEIALLVFKCFKRIWFRLCRLG